MSDPMKQAWHDVEDGFSTLGQMMRDRYSGARGSEGSEDEPRGGDYDAGAALRDAFAQLVAAGREFGERAAGVVRDEDVQAQLKKASGSLNDALSATADLIGEQVSGLFKRPRAGDEPIDVPHSEPPAEDARQ
jgi:hypothetical protein